MACIRFVRELKDHALGAPLGTPAAAHLAVCVACQALVARERRLVSAIDDAIARVAAAEPPVELPARLREIPRLVPRTRRAWRVAALVAGLAAVVFLTVRGRQQSAPDALPAMIRPPAASAAETAEPAAVNAPAARSASAHVSIAPRVARAGIGRSASDLEVLVPAGQPEMIARLLTSLQVQEADVASRLVGQTATGAHIDPAAAEPVLVAPILIKSVDVPELRALEPLLSN